MSTVEDDNRTVSIPNIFPLLCHGFVDIEAAKYVFRAKISHRSTRASIWNIQCPVTQGAVAVTRNKKPRCIIFATMPFQEPRCTIGALKFEYLEKRLRQNTYRSRTFLLSGGPTGPIYERISFYEVLGDG